MADNHSKEVRSMNMSHIRSKDSKPEEVVRKYLFSKGFRYRKNVKAFVQRPKSSVSKVSVNFVAEAKVLSKELAVYFLRHCSATPISSCFARRSKEISFASLQVANA